MKETPETPTFAPIIATAQWTDPLAEEHLEKCRVFYAAGDKRALAIAIQLCAGLGRVIPEWAATAFEAGVRAIVECEAVSWDEVLGPGNSEGKRLASEQRNRRWTLAIVEQLADPPPGPIVETFFEALAERLRNAGHPYVTSAQVRNLYYQLPEELRLPTGRR